MRCTACSASVTTITEYIRLLTIEKDMYVLRYIISCIVLMSYKEYQACNGILSRSYDSWYMCRNGHLSVDIIDDTNLHYPSMSRETKLFTNLTHIGLILGAFNYGKSLLMDRVSYIFAFETECVDRYSLVSSFRGMCGADDITDELMYEIENTIVEGITLSTYEVPCGLNVDGIRNALHVDGPYSFGHVAELMSLTRGALMW